ncbi:MAG: alpha-glucan family phosphorylase [Minisyncoccia bacterium]
MKNTDSENWFPEFKKSKEYEAFLKNPIAYFCSEYALDSTLPTYAGGLGVLAGDFIREAAMQKFPLVAVGLFYKKAQSILTLDKHEEKHKLKIITDKNSQEIIISVPIEGRTVRAKAWQWEENDARVYLLDTDIPDNDPRDRGITENLYDENRDIRLKQEILLGIGGFRLLAKMGHHASVYHLNEGHSAFLSLELVRHEMEHQQVNFEAALEYAKKHILFSNHTLVLAGQEQFSSDKVAIFMEKYAQEAGLEGKDIANLGISENPGLFSMTTLSFRLSNRSNAVSLVHQQEAVKVWPDQPMEYVTNGVFIPRWDKITNTSAKNIWDSHLENKKKLLTFIKEKTGEVWGEKDIIFGWARRLVEYKQPLLFLDNIEKLLEISKNSPVPIKIIFSGPTREEDSLFDAKIKKIIKEKLEDNAAFIPNYSTDLAGVLTSGVDIWLNTPVVGFEACGTSGMKAGLNGVLSLSTRDGWVYEVSAPDIGWVINEKELGGEIFSLVEKKIIPLYYEHLKNPVDSLWAGKMWKVRNLILEKFSTSRMLQEYIEKLYIPVLHQKHIHKVN